MRKSNFDKFPAIELEGKIWQGWEQIVDHIKEIKKGNTIAIETYHGVEYDQLKSQFQQLEHTLMVDTLSLMKPQEAIEAMCERYLTDDVLFGFRTSLSLDEFFDPEKLELCQKQIKEEQGQVVVFGYGASIVASGADTIIYADMARWEIQMRFRRKEVDGIGVSNRELAPSLHYKRGYFLDWVVCDKQKKKIFDRVDYWLDTNKSGEPKMISGELMNRGLEQTAVRPFRVVPFFDPAPWGGQWMKQVCDLDKEKANFGWCFDCVPEENSLYFKIDGTIFEMPSNNLVYTQTRKLLGEVVESRFGKEFPIRFDFLDTIGGGHLSLQVHPTTEYIRETFGIYYTQDESYYLLDTQEGATVYLGVKEGIEPKEMISALKYAQESGEPFRAEEFVNCWPAKKHDHYLIPAGTIHCSGAGAMVLEISTTPSIFTFKLWDWGRLGLDGKPRPINIDHGANVIDWGRTTEVIREKFVNNVQVVAEGEDWIEERTGLHENEFIETRRHWFSGKTPHNTGGGVNVLNVIEGDELIVESPTGAFEPYVVHYAETFIIPASVGDYTIRPYGVSEGKRCGTIKAYIRFK